MDDDPKLKIIAYYNADDQKKADKFGEAE